MLAAERQGRWADLKVFKPLGEEHVELAHPVDPEDFETLNLRNNGKSQSGTWEPVPMKLVRVDQGRHLHESDAPWLGSHALVLRAKAVQAMRPILENNGELLPLECSSDELYVFNPTNLIDCLDQEASDLVRFDNGRIMYIKRYAFRSEYLAGVDAFKIPGLRVSPLFATEAFVNRWTAAQLTGIAWQLVA